MTEQRVAPYGSWHSPLSTDQVVADSLAFSELALTDSGAYWVERRPTEGGRQVLVRDTGAGEPEEVTPPPFNVRTRVHEYGGGASLVAEGTAYFCHFPDQQLYVQPPGEAPRRLTDEPGHRFADLRLDARRQRLLCVREDHTVGEGRPSEVVNTLAAVELTTGQSRVLVEGHDFYAAPRLSPDGTQLLWLAWNHPNMPWDGTELWLGQVAEDGSIQGARRIAGGETEAIFQPEWSPDGTLFFVSDRTGWWNLYRWTGGEAEPLCPMEAEFGQPLWTFGSATYGFASPTEIVCAYKQDGRSHLARLALASGTLSPIETPYHAIHELRVAPGRALLLAGSPSEPWSIVRLELQSGTQRVLRRSSHVQIEPRYLSMPEAVEFPTEGGQRAHAFFYRPRNDDFIAPEGELPPLLVRAHGGPTGATNPVLNPAIQYWTSRGIAVLDVNYGGSTGYGRAYRQRLNGQWGVVDVADCVSGARFLAERGEVDGERLAITGGSAGGYTVLCALTFRDDFQAGASHFGIADLETFVRDTHKFESRYVDGLVGPFPEQRDLYHERSALHHVERLNRPLILFQGLEDRIVLPNQSEMIFEAARARGLPVAYLAFEGEQHGFRRAETIRRVLEAEFAFYARLFGYQPADPIEPVPIENA